MEVDGTLLTILGVSCRNFDSNWMGRANLQGYKTKSLKDVSKFLMIFISTGAILWLIME